MLDSQENNMTEMKKVCSRDRGIRFLPSEGCPINAYVAVRNCPDSCKFKAQVLANYPEVQDYHTDHDSLLIVPEEPATPDPRTFNVGKSDYAKHDIQPWQIWLEYGLNPWDADIVKRVLRTKEGDSRKLDYQKMIHICQERIRQLDLGYK